MRPGPRGGPGRLGPRLARAQRLAATPEAREPMTVLCAVLAHQLARVDDPTVAAAAALAAAASEPRRRANRFPLLDVGATGEQVTAELARVVAGLAGGPPVIPEPLAAAGRQLAGMPEDRRREPVRAWLEDPSLLDARLAFWVQAAAAPVLELAAAAVTVPRRHEWTGAACPLCGGPGQVSVIVEESGEFMAGSPRWMVCGRCATWWGFARATCPACGEDDSRRVASFVAEAWPAARIDACDSCQGYVKTFDLRRPGGGEVVPLVDDVASLVLDLWAGEQGLRRPVRSVAGV